MAAAAPVPSRPSRRSLGGGRSARPRPGRLRGIAALVEGLADGARGTSPREYPDHCQGNGQGAEQMPTGQGRKAAAPARGPTGPQGTPPQGERATGTAGHWAGVLRAATGHAGRDHRPGNGGGHR